MTDRATWLAERRKHIGSSDTPAILGLDPFRSATDVYWSKLVEIPDRDEKHFDMGRRLEDVICEWAADRLGVSIRRNVFDTSPHDPILAATFDALVEGKREAFEAKFSSQAAEWGDEGTDQVPERVLVQAQHQALVGELDCVWVPALIIGYTAEFRLYCVRPHADLMAEIAHRDLAFWRDHVEAKIPPDGSMVPPLAALKAIGRQPASVIDLDEPAAVTWESFEQARTLRKEAQETEDRWYATILAMLGEAEGGRLPDGRLITYLEQKSAPRCDTTRLRAVHKEIYDQFCSQGTHRVLRIKEPKKGKER